MITFNFDDWCSESWVSIKEKMVLEMPSENRQCRGRENMGGQLKKRNKNFGNKNSIVYYLSR